MRLAFWLCVESAFGVLDLCRASASCCHYEKGSASFLSPCPGERKRQIYDVVYILYGYIAFGLVPFFILHCCSPLLWNNFFRLKRLHISLAEVGAYRNLSDLATIFSNWLWILLSIFNPWSPDNFVPFIMPITPPLSAGFGYGIVLGLGFAFALVMITTTYVLKR